MGSLARGRRDASTSRIPGPLAVVDRAFGPDDGLGERHRLIEASPGVGDERDDPMSSSLIWTAVGLALAVFWAIIFPALRRRFGERYR